jgi:ankyrin repeat protein
MAMHGHTYLMKQLLKLVSLDLNQQDDDHQTPLLVAVKHRQP